MFDAEQKVADYILQNPQKIVQMSMAELAAASGTSDATVMRMCRHIGQSGFYQLKIGIAVETSDPNLESRNITGSKAPKDVVDYVEAFSDSFSNMPKSISMEQINQCLDLICKANTVYSFAWGNTNTIAQDLGHRFLRMGINTFCSDNIEYIFRGIILAKKHDVLVAISHSGQSVYTIESMKLAKAHGLSNILITNSTEGAAASYADVVLYCNVNSNKTNGWGNEWGGESHVAELMVIDMLLYFLKERKTNMKIGHKSEEILAQFKL